MVDVIVVSLGIGELFVPFDFEHVLDAMLRSPRSICDCAIVRFHASYHIVW